WAVRRAPARPGPPHARPLVPGFGLAPLARRLKRDTGPPEEAGARLIGGNRWGVFERARAGSPPIAPMSQVRSSDIPPPGSRSRPTAARPGTPALGTAASSAPWAPQVPGRLARPLPGADCPRPIVPLTPDPGGARTPVWRLPYRSMSESPNA